MKKIFIVLFALLSLLCPEYSFSSENEEKLLRSVELLEFEHGEWSGYEVRLYGIKSRSDLDILIENEDGRDLYFQDLVQLIKETKKKYPKYAINKIVVTGKEEKPSED